MKSTLVFLVCVLASVAESVHASPIDQSGFTDPTLINFDDLTGGNCNTCGPVVTDQYASLGVTFNDPTSPYEAYANTTLVPYFPLASGPNALFVDQGGMIGDLAAPFQILFSAPVTMVGFDFLISSGSTITLTAIGGNGQVLESLTSAGSSLPNGFFDGFAGLQESSPIVELDVSSIPSSPPARTFNFSIDNLEFQQPAVPEPSSLVLVVAGLFGIVFAGVRHSRKRSEQSGFLR